MMPGFYLDFRKYQDFIFIPENARILFSRPKMPGFYFISISENVRILFSPPKFQNFISTPKKIPKIYSQFQNSLHFIPTLNKIPPIGVISIFYAPPDHGTTLGEISKADPIRYHDIKKLSNMGIVPLMELSTEWQVTRPCPKFKKREAKKRKRENPE